MRLACSLGAPGQRQHDKEPGKPPPPVHRLLRSALHAELAPRRPAAHSITSSARARIDGHGEAERRGGLEIDDQLEGGRLLDRSSEFDQLRTSSPVSCRRMINERCSHGCR